MNQPTSKIDMLHGPLAMKMFMFAVPLIASGLLQQSFNAVDVAIASHFSGAAALGAIGANGPVLGLMVNMFLGLGIGLNVRIANLIGAGDEENARKAVASSMPLALFCSVALIIIGFTCGRWLLEILSTPDELIEEAEVYFRILVVGAPFLIVYNFASAILRSIGDSKRPFISLTISGFVNIGLSILFVAVMDMGVAGIAWGTVISTALNAALVVAFLLREKSVVRLIPSSFFEGLKEVRNVCTIGLPAGLQSTVFSFSNVFVLSAINSFGSYAVAGSAAAVNYEFYTYFVINAFGQTAVAFIGQNYGAGYYERCRNVFYISLIFSIFSALFINLGVRLFSGYFINIFTDNPSVSVFAHQRIATVLVWQFIACYYEMAAQSMRGMGHSLLPALITILGTCVVRVVWVCFLPEGCSFKELLYVYPVTWIITTLLMGIAYRHVTKDLFRQSQNVYEMDA